MAYAMGANKGVAPHAGAWIETVLKKHYKALAQVAPHAGAWIETTYGSCSASIFSVAPHAGAWIETGSLSLVYAKNVENRKLLTIIKRQV